MASCRSLGIHRPSAIPFLEAEGILPPDAPPSSYTWQIFNRIGGLDPPTNEELITTRYCVVWLRDGTIQRIFRFDIEKEPITQAILGNFPTDHNPNTTTPGPPRVAKDAESARPIETIDVPKQRARPTYQNQLPVPSKPEDNARVGFPGSNILGRNKGLALVVVLKSQAQIFFLFGTSHIIHLPFKVASVFPLAQGILLQRESSSQANASSKSLAPPAPANSFAFSQLSSSPAQLASQALSNTLKPEIQNDSSFLLPLFNSMLLSSNNPADSKLPSHFYLRDPLTELRAVVRSTTSDPAHSRTTARLKTRTKNLDTNDVVVYISSRSEIQPVFEKNSTVPSLILAVTLNQDSGYYKVWIVSEAPIDTKRGRDKRMSKLSGAVSKRRSSYGPGTGTTTPGLRTSMGLRESFGVSKDSRDIHDDAELASQLDPAFENPGAPAKSSRRISSLLARSDLAVNRDPSTFNDLASGHSFGARRGPSFGPGGHGHFTRRSAYLGTEHEGFFSPQSSQMAEESDSEDDQSFTASMKKRHSFRDSQSELVFTKVYTFSQSRSRSPQSKDLDLPTVFTIRSPRQASDDIWEIPLCINDSANREFSSVLIRAKIVSKSNNPTSGRDFATEIKHSTYSDIIDACKISGGHYSRVLILRATADGFGELKLESPWSVPITVELPKKFLVQNPTDITSVAAEKTKREGGLRRVLSEGPRSLTGLKSVTYSGHVGIRDERNVWHRIEVRLAPKREFIARAIRLCELIIPAGQREREPLLRAWWSVRRFISSMNDVIEDPEWACFVVVLFLMVPGITSDRQSQAPVRTKRKSGLLRSSSGATIDLESFDRMMLHENRAKSTPDWLHDPSWSWINNYTHVPPTLKRSSRTSSTMPSLSNPFSKKTTFLLDCMNFARQFSKTDAGKTALGSQGYLPSAACNDLPSRRATMPRLLVALHLYREELKLDTLASADLDSLAPVLAQIGGWLGWESWSWREAGVYVSESTDLERWAFDEWVTPTSSQSRQVMEPPSILAYIEEANIRVPNTAFPTLLDISSSTPSAARALKLLSPRTFLVLELLRLQQRSTADFLSGSIQAGLDPSILETLPEGVAASIRSAVSACQPQPDTTMPASVLELIDRTDMTLLDQPFQSIKPQFKTNEAPSHDSVRDYHGICVSTLDGEKLGAYDGTAEMDRQAVTRMIFKDDQRFSEAAKLLHPLNHAVARCMPEPEWSDTDLLEAQQELVKVIAVRTLSVSPGRGMLFYSARFPLLTEKFPIHGFTLSCIMKPSNTTVTAERSIYTEEKVSWAFFHAGVEAGLSISKSAKGIDTSWISFNKPSELNNRHAGFLLALGLNGHLKSIAKWVAFKYLTPKHTMTSIGLLLGLAASYLGTMDTLITRLLSVHVTRMLPPGAAELNLSPLTQTTGVMAIGLLYCRTQHRRMSEVMLSEMENTEQDDNISPMDNLRDEGYRLAAGFALGFINLGQGNNLKGLHDMHLVERLLSLAVATKMVQLVHILDKATAAATVAVSLIFMKTEDRALAKKIDIPDTIHQFEYIRPDIFLLRTVASNLIMWSEIKPTATWIRQKLPIAYQARGRLTGIRSLHTEDLPLFNIIAGLCLSIGLRFAGTARQDVRDLLGHYLDQFIRICRLPALNYDGKLTRITTRNCQDAIALVAAGVMAGTGDIYLFRRLRALHGRTDPDTPYGSHVAAHQAIGILFLGGGTHTFSTNNLAIASLLCAFYPLFPTSVLDNKSHLQAFRHFWVLACEPRCLVVRNVDTYRPIELPIVIVLRNGTEYESNAPCLLPELDSIASVYTNDPNYWRVTLDFAGNSTHLAAFKRHQSMFVRKRGAYDASSTTFAATMQALNDSQLLQQATKRAFEWVFTLKSLKEFDVTERALVLPAGNSATLHNAMRSTPIDDRLVLEKNCMESEKAERLWNLRVLLAWAERCQQQGLKMGWIGEEAVNSLRAKIMLQGRENEEH